MHETYARICFYICCIVFVFVYFVFKLYFSLFFFFTSFSFLFLVVVVVVLFSYLNFACLIILKFLSKFNRVHFIDMNTYVTRVSPSSSLQSHEIKKENVSGLLNVCIFLCTNKNNIFVSIYTVVTCVKLSISIYTYCTLSSTLYLYKCVLCSSCFDVVVIVIVLRFAVFQYINKHKAHHSHTFLHTHTHAHTCINTYTKYTRYTN